MKISRCRQNEFSSDRAMHCAKSMARSNIWKTEAWPNISDIPSLAGAMVAHGKLADTKIQMQDIIDNDFESRMY